MEFHYPLIEEEARKAFLNAPPTHDFLHTKRVLNLCFHIGEEEGGDAEILYAAAMLHDIARFEADRDGRCHAEMSAEMSAEILPRAKFPHSKIRGVLHCISTHRFRGDNPPETPEAKILFDADKLDAIGAIGVCRAYAYCGENGQRLYSDFSPEDFQKAPEQKISRITDHSRHTPILEFQLKLSRIKDRLYTNTARKIAEERHLFIKSFFLRLYEEVRGNL